MSKIQKNKKGSAKKHDGWFKYYIHFYINSKSSKLLLIVL